MLKPLAKSRLFHQVLSVIGLRSISQSLLRQQFRRSFRARYDAAVTNDENRRHWANADALSADAAADPAVRRTLRMRSRYETANNSYAKGIVDTLANYTIGTGPRLQMLTEDAEANRAVERKFAKWARAVGLAAKLHTMRTSRTADGECFAVMPVDRRLQEQVQLNVLLIEADQVATPDMAILQPNVVDGVEYDEIGNPLYYHILKQHPGDVNNLGLGLALDYYRVPAELVIHYFKPSRPGQHRGIPEITPALPLFAQLRRYTLAVIAAAETAAEFAGVLQTQQTPEGEPTDKADALPLVEIERRMLTPLPEGWQLAQMKAEQPATTYGDFVERILNEIARCLNMPFNIAAGNSSKYNYASGRLDHQMFFKSIDIDQQFTEDTVLDQIFMRWLNAAILVENYLPQSLRMLDSEFPHQWFWDGIEHVDPAKEADAQATRLENNTTTLANEYARQGRDWEVELRQRAKEKKLVRELGLEEAPVTPDGKEAEDHGEDEDTE